MAAPRTWLVPNAPWFWTNMRPVRGTAAALCCVTNETDVVPHPWVLPRLVKDNVAGKRFAVPFVVVAGACALPCAPVSGCMRLFCFPSCILGFCTRGSFIFWLRM